MNRSLESVALALVALSGCSDTGQRPAAGRENTITIICDPGLCGSPWGDSRGLLFLPPRTC